MKWKKEVIGDLGACPAELAVFSTTLTFILIQMGSHSGK